MAEWCRRLAEHPRFQVGVLGLIILNAILIGVETSRSVMSVYGPLLMLLNHVVQALFVAELAIRLVACWPRPLDFFKNGWNLFDFSVIAISMLPVAGSYAAVSRLARLLRVVRLISVSADLRLIIETMLRSIPSMGHVVVLLSVLVYVYAILGFNLYHPSDPAHWGSLRAALLSVFQLLTLEGWVEMHQAVAPGHPLAWLYFSSFIVLGVFIIINLFIAVVLNNLETVKIEQDRRSTEQEELLQQVEELRAQLEAFEGILRRRQTLPRDRSEGREEATHHA